MRKMLLAVVALALAGCSGEPPASSEPRGFDMKVQLTVAPTHTERLTQGCQAKPIVRIDEGTTVVVRDGAGETIGAGQLGTGVVQSDGACMLTAEVPINAPSEFYEVTFGTREPVTMPADRVVDNKLGLRIGY